MTEEELLINSRCGYGYPDPGVIISAPNQIYFYGRTDYTYTEEGEEPGLEPGNFIRILVDMPVEADSESAYPDPGDYQYTIGKDTDFTWLVNLGDGWYNDGETELETKLYFGDSEEPFYITSASFYDNRVVYHLGLGGADHTIAVEISEIDGKWKPSENTVYYGRTR